MFIFESLKGFEREVTKNKYTTLFKPRDQYYNQ